MGKIGCELGVEFLSADFNCTVTDPEYVNEILDQLKINYQTIWDKVLYVEQLFHIKYLIPDRLIIYFQLVKNFVHIFGVCHRAVKISTQKFNTQFASNLTHIN